MRSRMYVIADLINKWGLEDIVEVGCGGCATSEHLLNYCPTIKSLTLIDIKNVPPKHMLNNSKVKFFNMDSEKASKLIKEKSVDLVFIDGDHSYEWVLKDIKNYLPKIKSGGIISGHDYDFPDWIGVKKAVDSCFADIEKELEPDLYNQIIPMNYTWWKYIG